MSRQAIIVLLLLALIAAVVFVTGNPSGAVQGSAPDIAIQGAQGVTSLSSLKGKVVLLDFWATWCGPCRESMPAIERLYEERNKDGFAVLGVSVDTEPAGVAPFVKKMGITYPAGLPVKKEMLKPYAGSAIPQMILVNRRGEICWHQEGYGPATEDVMRGQVEKALKD